LRKVADAIANVQNTKDITQITNLKKLKPSSHHYRIKIGDYRLGLIISGSEVEFIRCLPERIFISVFQENNIFLFQTLRISQSKLKYRALIWG
jgi:mRNA interferase RelE/StbE